MDPSVGSPIRVEVPPPSSARFWSRRRAVDVLLASALALAVYLVVHQLFLLIGPGPFDRRINDVWFHADADRVLNNITRRAGNHYRSSVHPLFSLLMLLPRYLLSRLLHLSPIATVPWLVSIEAGIWVASLYALLRALGLGPGGAGVFTLVGATSGAAVIWLPIVETYTAGSITLMWAMIVAIVLGRRPAADWQLVATSALTMSVTISNWMAGMLLAIAHRPWRRALQITVNTLALVTVLWTVEKILMPSSQYFFGSKEERKYLLVPDPVRFVRVAVNYALNPIVLPDVSPGGPNGGLSLQQADPRSASLPGRIGVVAWVLLLALAIPGAVRARLPRRFLVVFGGTLAGQFLLHLVYGGETFLYALHWVPLLVAFAALSVFGPARRLALALAVTLAGAAAVNNAGVFRKAVASLLDRTSAHGFVLRESGVRPGDPWPRGEGHTILAIPGSADTLKGYLEPGGSFSPIAGSFGVSFWVLGGARGPRQTSDGIPLVQVRQSFVRDSARGAPAIRTQTPYYTVDWALLGPNAWRADIRPAATGGDSLAVVIRSVGPAGGPVRHLTRSGGRLVVNGRWEVSMTAAEPGAYTESWVLGSEQAPRWRGSAGGPGELNQAAGWGFAKLRLSGSRPSTLLMTDRVPRSTGADPFRSPYLAIEHAGGDQPFWDCLAAQADHLSMGVAGDELRPGDPLAYRFPWARDAAYMVVAMARAGQIAAAQRLVGRFVHEDFFGGFGAEADAPGLGIWALTEVAVRAGDAGFEAAIWPAIERKAELIERFLTAQDSTWGAVYGPVLPEIRRDWDQKLVTQPSRDGLVIGRMDGQWRVLHTSAVSYLGLMDAAAMARRRGETALAARWRDRAGGLRQAWARMFAGEDNTDDRTYISALWPTGIARGDEAGLSERLLRRWRAGRDTAGDYRVRPLFTYFPIAEAHQWLLLGQEDRVWATLRWFWSHQSSPGLYTWWEGANGNQPSEAWERVRGWVRPNPVTPHYWTAAEMLLLQIDMLAYERSADQGDTLVIGAGVPGAWLARPMAVRGLSLRSGRLDWSWDGRAVHVRRGGPRLPVVLGGAFPAGTPVSYESHTVLARR